MENVVLNKIYRDRHAVKDGSDHPQFEDALSMVGKRRLDNLHMLLLYVIKNNIQGDFIETGAWRGGTCLFAAAVFDTYRQFHRRKVFIA